MKKYWSWIGLGCIIVIAFLLRVVGQLDEVFVDGTVLFRGVDAWYHMRVIDNMVVNFPHILRWDYYACWANGSLVGFYPLMHWIVVGISYIVGLGNYEYVAAFLPPILGCLTLVLVYLIGKEISNYKVGLIACILLAFLPTEFFHRSLLGFTDQHMLEVFLMALTSLFIIHLNKSGKYRYIVGAGITLGLYFLNWHGAGLLAFIIGIYFWFSFIYKFMNKENQFLLCRNTFLVGLIGLLVSVSYLHNSIDAKINLISLGLVIVMPIFFYFFTKVIKNREWFIFFLGVIIPAVAFTVAWLVPLRTIFGPVFWGFGTYIGEAVPLLLDPRAIIANFGLSFLLMIGGLYFVLKKDKVTYFTIWSIVMFLAAMGQRRWAYYFSINIALLAAFFIYRIGNWVKPTTRSVVLIVICFFCLLPNIKGTVSLASYKNEITPDWYNAMVWMEKNTPNPFEGRDTYYSLEEKPTTTEGFIEGRGDYGVLSWWDYGHWIIRIGRRVPLGSPTHQGDGLSPRVITAQTGDAVIELLKGQDVRYLIIDEDTLTTKFYAVAMKSKKDLDRLDQVRQDSFVFRLWQQDNLGDFRLVYNGGTVRIYEYKNWKD